MLLIFSVSDNSNRETLLRPGAQHHETCITILFYSGFASLVSPNDVFCFKFCDQVEDLQELPFITLYLNYSTSALPNKLYAEFSIQTVPSAYCVSYQ